MFVRALTLSTLLASALGQSSTSTQDQVIISSTPTASSQPAPTSASVSASASSGATSQAVLPANSAQPTTLTVSTTLVSFVATSSTSDVPVATATPAVPTGEGEGDVVPYAPEPPTQYWCEQGSNASYCAGPLLQLVQLSQIYGDSKTFSDKPTRLGVNQTFQAFGELPQNATYGEVLDFAEEYFTGEGQELNPVTIQGFNSTPAVLDQIDDQFYKGFVSLVNGYWALLIRETNESAICNGTNCDSSLIPLNRTIVVPGGRYREIYYWDSYWILEGLLRSQLYSYAEDLLVNFMDLVESYGFLPNGGRKYYLNRSQPPVFTMMVNSYVQVTGNTSVLERALPILETELEWWRVNRSISITSPYTSQNHTVYRYDVSINTAPRPEGYIEDFNTAFGAEPALNESQRSDLYAELATGAESGWDYSSRWCKEPLLNVTDNLPALRTLNARAIIPVDLNALLYGDHVLLADLYERYMAEMNGSADNATMSNLTSKVTQHRMIANETREAIIDLHWDADKKYFYDFNTTADARADLFHAGGLFPLWQNITPPEIVSNETAALQVFEGIRYIAGKYSGSPSVATLLETGLNWDFPNVWPPHTYTSIKALETVGRLYPNGTVLDTVLSTDFSAIPTGQLGMNETDLPVQPADAIGPNSELFAKNVAEIQAGKPWWQAIAIEYANRYMQSTFCSWYATGGEIPGLLQSLPGDARSGNAEDNGHMFEKFNGTDVDAAGGGGEYEVVIGFGWTNGVVLWTAGEYGQYLATPTCPLITIIENDNSTMTTMGNGTTSSSLFRGVQLPRTGA
ncbi:Six-hairpin glycosidase-like protein [Filobasidium floriforme]|uniref:Six-hairpin glycosidase-like protein n=1 Tax=Filobasidium floriforme TaxID=5210 RepID=UPI001E8DB874|nr:Six-hairpin glycosidase-like protein [Filobasidium floriforme]KAH8085188.1 Six-hairpin glycosidase-like protein [Filobasidium floriforme]